MEPKKTLYIGAHPDDVLIGAGITIARNPENAIVLILSNGATLNEEFPAKHGEFLFDGYEAFAKTRIREDRRAMHEIGLDVTNSYFILEDIPTETAYTQIPFFVSLIKRLIKRKGIERLVTHEFGEAHPDHEIASFCTHHAANRLGLRVWEYPLYQIDKDEKEVAQRFVSNNHSEICATDYNPEEIQLKNRLLRLYKSQIYIADMFTAPRDQFGRIQRDFSNGEIPETTYFYKDSPGHPKPEEIRAAITSFLSQSKPI